MNNLGLRQIEMKVLDTVHAVFEIRDDEYVRVSQYYSRQGDAIRKQKQLSGRYYKMQVKVLSFELYLDQASIR